MKIGNNLKTVQHLASGGLLCVSALSAGAPLGTEREACESVGGLSAASSRKWLSQGLNEKYFITTHIKLSEGGVVPRLVNLCLNNARSGPDSFLSLLCYL